jgi:hypothetical protein
MKNIGLSNQKYLTVGDNHRIYTATWIHEEQKFLFVEVTDQTLLEIMEPNLSFEQDMTITVNTGIDYYENIYKLSKDETGTIKSSLIAIGLLNNSFYGNAN